MNWGSNLALDASSSGNNGTLVNMTPANAVMGVIGQALSFNGTSQYVDLGNPSSLQLATAGTVSAWVKTTSTCPSSFCGIATKNGSYAIVLGSNGDLLAGDWHAGVWYDSGIKINNGIWHHVVFSIKSGVANGSEFYVDGKSGPVTTMTFNPSSSDVLIGSLEPTAYYLNGSIDDVRIYDRALSATEVKQLYNLGR